MSFLELEDSIMFRLVSCLAMLVVLVGAGPLAANSGPQDYRITIEAFIDGTDELIIQDDTLQWYHLAAERPGKWHGSDYP